jgi:hypothetical protein
MPSTSETLLRQGQYIGSFPVEYSQDFAKLVSEQFPNRNFAFLGDSVVKLLVYPHLDQRELGAWRRLYQQKCRDLRIYSRKRRMNGQALSQPAR